MLPDEAVLSTLVYASLFKSAISKQRLLDWLISDTKISQKDVQKSVKHLLRRKLIFQDGDFLSLSRYVVVNQIQKRKTAREKVRRARDAIHSITWIPWITGIALTGSVAAENANEDEDIDVMIITSKNALWITRALVSTQLALQGKLRLRHVPDVTNKLCLNLWLDESALVMKKQTAYVAREVSQALWLFERANTRKHFLQANAWITSFLAQVKIPKGTSLEQNFSFVFINDFFYKVQRSWMGEISVKERVGKHFAFFHPGDKSSDLMREYRTRRKKILEEYHGI
ncbi:MAG TPA: hypothetical protein VLH19_01385 [Patescibacteria group bacterium]|nr:hypothetical protein [Patescibacteria group bacterium]